MKATMMNARKGLALMLALCMGLTLSIGALAESSDALTAAQNAALAHAGLTENQVTRLYAERDDDEYEISFEADQVAYEYEISTRSGEIHKVKMQDMAAYLNARSITDATISSDEALAAALAHAGLSEADVTVRKIEVDRHDGAVHYEVKFYTDEASYEYEISAGDGSVLECEIEYAVNAQRGGRRHK
ncbi:PepSY domain-containing protein [Eubacteriales bacterium OttesenSCG-928-A19]|nr:PepSY domain-containing protein [Eubacteriales bacterium OttesenSCG-928-A19]